MSEQHEPPQDQEEIEATAAVWLIMRDRGMTEAETAEFMGWLQQSPRHAEEFADLDRVWRQFDRAPELSPASTTPGPAAGTPKARLRHRWRVAAISGLLTAAAAVAVVWFNWRQATPTATTPVGAFQKLDLPDGSFVRLNTDSAIKVRYSDRERRIDLLRGEAHFEVARLSGRPFVVSVEQVAVRAVGTAFNVRLRADSVDVLVTEGTVQVQDMKGGSLLPSADRSGAPVLAAGERVVVPLAGAMNPVPPPAVVTAAAPAEVQRSLAWQQRRLEFDDLPLAEVLAEFNRYNQTKLVLADSALGAKRFSGTFHADNYEPFLRLLEENFHVTTTRRPQEIELRAGR